MQFYETFDNPKINMDTICSNPHSQPISVIANFNVSGRIMPVYLSLVDYYGNVCKTKIEGVKYTKEGNGYTTFCCLINNNLRQQQINITFYVQQHLWVLNC